MNHSFSSWRSPSNEHLKKGFRIHLLVFVLTIPAIWVIWYVTDTTYYWPIWPTASWTIGITFHYLGVFVFKRSTKNLY